MDNRLRFSAELPLGSGLTKLSVGKGYEDAFYFSITTPAHSAQTVYVAVFGHLPAGIQRLLRWRNKLAGLLGFEISDLTMAVTLEQIQHQSHIGKMQIIKSTTNEVIIGNREQHMDVWLSAQRVGGDNYAIATRVNLHTNIGRGYMALIKPFHKRVASYSISSAIQQGRL